MLCPLPAETVFEARKRIKRDTFFLFILLLLIYIVFFNLLVFATIFLSSSKNLLLIKQRFPEIAFITSSVGILAAIVHFYFARNKSLDEILSGFGAMKADPNDRSHAIFINVVQEAESAVGIHGIVPVILPSAGNNAFSIEDGNENRAIGITEGLLAQLNRPELSSVVAHEAAHLANGDSRLMTTASALMGVFDGLRSLLKTGTSRGTSYISGSDRASSLQGALWLIASAGYGITRVTCMAISREREYLADSLAVQMSKDPLSLAEALYKISQRYRGSLDVSQGFAGVFIVNPSMSSLDEQDGLFADLFSTHPPIARRLDKLMGWAKSDLTKLQESVELTELKKPSDDKEEQSEPKFYAKAESEWKGPYTPTQILAMAEITPSTWITGEDKAQVSQAGDNPFLAPLFTLRISGKVSKSACPRCKVPLVEVDYEGAPVLHCGFCKGHLLKKGEMERVIIRQDKVFSQKEIQETKIWRNAQKGQTLKSDHFPDITCPLCKGSMNKGFYTALTSVVVDRCENLECGAIWCDGGELDRIQILVEGSGDV